MTRIPKYIKACLFVCTQFSKIIAVLHHYTIKLNLTATPAWFDKDDFENREKLNGTWNTRIARRFISVAVRSIFRKDILRLVEPGLSFPKDKGIVIAFCHTPWKRLLLQWCIEQKNILVIAGASLKTKNACIDIRPCGYTGLRKLVNHLQNKGHVAIALDNFTALKNCPVNFLGTRCNASLLPIRLSKLGNVSLVTVVPIFKEGKVRFIKGPDIVSLDGNVNLKTATQNLVTYLENKIKKEPYIWSEFAR